VSPHSTAGELGSDGDDDGPLSDGTAAAAAALDVSRRSSGGSLAPVQSAISRATWRVKMNAAQSSAPAHRQTSKSVVKMQKKHNQYRPGYYRY